MSNWNTSKKADAKDSSNGERHTAAIKELFDQHNRTLIGFLHARLHDAAEAHDVAQEAYVRMLELDNPGAIGFLRSYLFKIASNLAIDRLRHRAVREQPEPQSPDHIDYRDPERIAIGVEELSIIRRVIRSLPERSQRAFLWYVFDGKSTGDIAVRLGLTDRMIRLYIAQGIAGCRAALHQHQKARSR